MLHRLRSRWAGPLRSWAWLVITIGLSILCAVWGALLWQARTSWAERATFPLRDPLANLNQLGVNVDLVQYDAGQLERVLDQIAAADVRWVRQRFPWDQIEQQRGALDWAKWDEIVQACAAHELNIIAVLDATPTWARGAGTDTSLAPPHEISEWGDFAAHIAARYRGRIAAYQLWDEPNLTSHWGNRYIDPVGYVALLREGAVRIRAADPSVPILMAALAPTTETGPLNLNEIDFLRAVVGSGGASFFDIVALQPYGFGDPPAAAPGLAALNYRRVELVRREMIQLGLGNRPVWATACGWSHLPPEWEGGTSPWPNVSPEQQVAYTLDGLQLARREWPWMGPIVLYALQPDVTSTDPRWGFALLDEQGNAAPLFERLRAYNTARQPLYTGTYVPSTVTAHLVGAWRFSGAGADPPRGADGDAQNAKLSFDTIGTALDITVRRGNYWGVLYVSVDGAPATGLPRDERGRSYIVLYDPAGQVETLSIARGLSRDISHHVELVAHGGWGQWPIVSWTVYDEQLSPPTGAYWIFALLTVGAALAAGGQIALVPQIRRPIYGAIGRAFRWYRALPEWIPALATLGSTLAFYWVPWTPLALSLLALFFVLTFLRIDLGLAAVALALPFYTQPKVLLGRPFSIVELGMAICIGAWLLARLLDLGRAMGRSASRPLLWRLEQVDLYLRALPTRLWLRWTWIDKGMLALLLLAGFSLNWTANRHVALYELRTVFVESVLFYALIRLSVRSPRAHRRVIEGWLLGAVVISAVGIGQLLAGHNLITAEGVWRVRGLYGSPNNLALYLERPLLVLLAVAWQGRDRSRRVVYGLAALPVLVALVMTLSKGALLIGLPLALMALGLVQRDRRAVWIALGGVAVLGLLVLPFAFTERFRSVLNLRAGTAFFRLKLWRSTLAMIADHPITGVGMDNFLYAYRSRYVLPSAWGELDLSHPHNLVLDAWTRLGIGGVVTLAWLFFAFFRTTWRQLQTAVGDRRALLQGLFVAGVVTLAHGMVDHAVFLVDLSFVFALVLAIAQPTRST